MPDIPGISNSIKGLNLATGDGHMYRQIEYKAGAAIEVIKCIPKGCRKGAGRSEIKKKTHAEMQEANMRQAARKLARKINANFKPGDWHITLTYRKEERPSPKEAQKALTGMLNQIRRQYKDSGFQLKYIAVTEYKNKSIHHHVIINHINTGTWTTTDAVRRLWKGRGSPKFVSLYEDGEYSRLAEYLVKETEKTFRDTDSPVRQRYSCSRNLITPKPEIRQKKAKTWRTDPKPRPGYYIAPDTLYNGFDKFGYPYQRYLMIKLNPEDSDWTSCTWPPGS